MLARSVEDGWIADIANNKRQQAGNKIHDEGARALSDALKVNATLVVLDLGCEQEVWKMDELQTLPTTNTNKQGTRLVMKEKEHWRSCRKLVLACTSVSLKMLCNAPQKQRPQCPSQSLLISFNKHIKQLQGKTNLLSKSKNTVVIRNSGCSCVLCVFCFCSIPMSRPILWHTTIKMNKKWTL